MEWYKTKLAKYLFLLVAIAIFLPVIFIIWYRFFGGDYGINLPGGYSLDRVYAGAVLISDSDSICISPNIDGYKVYEDKHLVIGHVSSENLPAPESEYSVPGYFIINTQKRSIVRGLDEKTWLDSLRIFGVMEKLHLHKPSRFDRNYQ